MKNLSKLNLEKERDYLDSFLERLNKTKEQAGLNKVKGSIDPKTREMLIKAHLELVNSISQKYRNLNTSLFSQEDLKSYGTIGLIGAVDKFDADKTKNSNLKNFFALRIKGAISDYLRKQDNLSRSSRKNLKELQKNVDLLINQNKEIKEEELAYKMGISKDKLREIQKNSEFTVLSLDFESSDDGENKSSFYEKISDPKQDLEFALEKKLLRKKINQVLKTLPSREKKTIVLYYFNGFTMKQIAKIFNVSESRACQIRSRALLILRSKLKSSFSYLSY